MALQADGKIVMVGGYTDTAAASAYLVVRFNANGSVDPTFGTNGVVTLSFGGTEESGTCVDIQPDGKIVVARQTKLTGAGVQVAFARLHPDGSLDTTFSGDGKTNVGFVDFLGVPKSGIVQTMKVAGNGKIVVAGHSGSGQNLQYYTSLGRLTAVGSFDSTFDSDGRVWEGLGSGIWHDLVANADGTVFVAGYSGAMTGSTLRVVKFNDNGTKAWTYIRSDGAGCGSNFNAIAMQADGKVVVGGSNNCHAVAYRLTVYGNEDPAWSSPFVPDADRVLAVAIQPDGKIVASLNLQITGSDGVSVVRYNQDGSFDTTFGSGGVIRTRAFNTREAGQRIVIQPDGKILVGGWTGVGTNCRFAMVRYMGEAAAPSTPLFDYDGGGRADISVFRPSENKWYILRSSDQGLTSYVFAIAGDVAVPADFDGDGRTEAAVFRPSSGDWWYLSSINNAQVYTHWGQAGDIPRPSDFDGDGKTDFVVYRPSTSIWYRLSATGQMSSIAFGTGEDKPLIGDFDGDGKSDPAIYRPSTGDWWYAASSAAGEHRVTHWGSSTDIPAPGDYDGDGTTDLAVYRPSQGSWYILNSGGTPPSIVGFGLAEDKPVPADYDGDGRVDLAVFRPSTGLWYLLRSTAGFTATPFGISTDIPTPNAFVP